MARWPYSTARWQRLRLAKLAADPLCYACELRGEIVPAVAVDHVRAINAGGEPFPALDGLMSMCERCHSDKTNALDRPTRASSGRRFKGFDLNGNPIDPGDAWHGGAPNHENGRSSGPAPKSNAYLVSRYQ